MAEKPKRRVALQTHNLLPLASSSGPASRFGRGGAIVGCVRRYRVAESYAHGCVGAGVETEARVRDGEDGARDIHCVCAFGDVDDGCVVRVGEGVEGALDGGKGVGGCHWCFCV